MEEEALGFGCFWGFRGFLLFFFRVSGSGVQEVGFSGFALIGLGFSILPAKRKKKHRCLLSDILLMTLSVLWDLWLGKGCRMRVCAMGIHIYLCHIAAPALDDVRDSGSELQPCRSQRTQKMARLGSAMSPAIG